MWWSDEITLIKTSVKTNPDGSRDEKEVSRRTVFADVEDAARTEFYQAKQTGLDVVMAFKVLDYKKETLVEYTHEGDDAPTAYRVIRSFPVGGGKKQLNCSLKSTPASVGRRRAVRL